MACSCLALESVRSIYITQTNPSLANLICDAPSLLAAFLRNTRTSTLL